MKNSERISKTLTNIVISMLIGLSVSSCSKKEDNSNFALVIKKSSNGKYFNQMEFVYTPFDIGSTKEVYVNLDDDSTTIEQYTLNVGIKSDKYLLWKPVIKLIKPGFQTIVDDGGYYDGGGFQEMTLEKQEIIDSKFVEERKIWEVSESLY